MNNIRSVTIKDIARESGVSAQTVSRVVNNHPDVSPATKEKVQNAILKLGYAPSAVARRLVQKHSCLIGIVASVYDFYTASGMTVVGVQKQARAQGYSLLLQLLHQPDTPNPQEILNNFISEGVDGIVWAVPEIGNSRAWFKANLENLRLPIIFLNTQPYPGLNVVSIDNRLGGRIATEHLLENGYRKIGYIAGPEDWWVAKERRLGWQDALSSYGILPGPRQIAYMGTWSPEGGVNGLQILLEQFPDIEAVFTCNDNIALGALKAAHERGLRVPEDLAVVGFDNRPETAFYDPSLTTVYHQVDELGSLAVRELGRLIEAQQSGRSTSHLGAILLQPTVVVRESSLKTNGSVKV